MDNKCFIVQIGEKNLVLMIPLLSARLLKIATLNKLIQEMLLFFFFVNNWNDFYETYFFFLETL